MDNRTVTVKKMCDLNHEKCEERFLVKSSQIWLDFLKYLIWRKVCNWNKIQRNELSRKKK